MNTLKLNSIRKKGLSTNVGRVFAACLFAIYFLSACDTVKEDPRPNGGGNPPILHSDHLSTERNQTVEFNPLGNDTVFAAATIQMGSPKNGIVEHVSNTTYKYIPFRNFRGFDTIPYSIILNGRTSHANVFLNVGNAVVCSPRAITGIESLVNGGEHNFPVVQGTACDTTVLAIVGTPRFGSTVLEGAGFTYKARTDVVGRDTVRFRLTHYSGNVSQGQWIINVTGGDNCREKFIPKNDSVTITGNQVMFLPLTALLSNDSHCQNDINPASFAITSMPDANRLNLEVVGNNIRLSKVGGFNGREFFSYRVCGLDGAYCGTATVSVTLR